MDWLDYGRLLAALFVMLAHYCFVALDPRINTKILSYGLLTQISSYGMISLYFFFITSGLLVFPLIQRQTPRKFLIDRITRIYPTYLLAMSLTTIISRYGPPGTVVGPARFFADLLMAGPLLGMKHVDAVYWTLVIEIQFYTLLLMLKLMGLLEAPQRWLSLWTGMMVVSFGLRIDLPLLGSSFHFIAAGVTLSLIYEGKDLQRNFILLAVISVMCLGDAYRFAREISIAPLPLIGLTAALFPLFLILRNCQWRLPFAGRIGSLTYPLYLLHFHIGLVLIYRFGTEAKKYQLVAIICLGMIAVSTLIDEVMTRRLRRRLTWWARRYCQIKWRCKVNGRSAS